MRAEIRLKQNNSLLICFDLVECVLKRGNFFARFRDALISLTSTT